MKGKFVKQEDFELIVKYLSKLEITFNELEESYNVMMAIRNAKDVEIKEE